MSQTNFVMTREILIIDIRKKNLTFYMKDIILTECENKKIVKT